MSLCCAFCVNNTLAPFSEAPEKTWPLQIDKYLNNQNVKVRNERNVRYRDKLLPEARRNCVSVSMSYGGCPHHPPPPCYLGQDLIFFFHVEKEYKDSLFAMFSRRSCALQLTMQQVLPMSFKVPHEWLPKIPPGVMTSRSHALYHKDWETFS